MVQYSTPGVYIEEQLATGPIVGVGTSTVAFLGVAGTGPIAQPVPITNLSAFNERFISEGPLADVNAPLVRGVRGFFENGGTSAYVTRIGVSGKRASVELEGANTTRKVLRITARRAGAAGDRIKVQVADPTSVGDPQADARFNLVITGPEENQTQTYENLSMNPATPNFVGSMLDDADAVVSAALITASERTAPKSLSTAVPLAGGADESPAENEEAWKAALAALAKVDEVSLVCAPGVTSTSVQQLLIDHCQLKSTMDRFAILDAPRGADTAAVKLHRQALASRDGYAALYHPWLTIAHPDRAGETLEVAPSGHVAGVFARVDAQRGVHKAPANELLAGVLGVQQAVDDTEHGQLNDDGVNVLRTFPGRSRPVIWGARTIAENTAWRYINVRRLMLFIEESIQEGIRWAVFEPNDLALWKRLNRTITEFLTRVWSSGALFGDTAAKAFYVKIDEENNPPDKRELGQVFVDVGVAPVRPAEFVIVRIGIWAGGGQVQEG